MYIVWDILQTRSGDMGLSAATLLWVLRPTTDNFRSILVDRIQKLKSYVDDFYSVKN